jgi:hypothetical protein
VAVVVKKTVHSTKKKNPWTNESKCSEFRRVKSLRTVFCECVTVKNSILPPKCYSKNTVHPGTHYPLNYCGIKSEPFIWKSTVEVVTSILHKVLAALCPRRERQVTDTMDERAARGNSVPSAGRVGVRVRRQARRIRLIPSLQLRAKIRLIPSRSAN